MAETEYGREVSDMQSEVEKILREGELCVLCTSQGDIPDASLMLYVYDDSCAKLLMLTLKETTKYANILRNPNVSLLVDTRDKALDPSSQTRALTIRGRASILEDGPVARQLLDQLVKKHRSLSNLASNHSVRLIEVSIQGVLFLENVDKVNDLDLHGK